jgi:pimeloyl-ACP methyl ester carboxylesterase
MKKRRRRLLSVLSASALILLALLYMKRPHTPAIRDEKGRRPPHAVSHLMKMRLGGRDQWILIRGRDTSNPVLLFLHGGPGMPLMYLAHAFQRPIEEDFICVQWDRRGAGKSFDPSLPKESLTVRRLLEDTYELVDILQALFGKQKIYLAGHSFGSYLGMLAIQERPELFQAYFGIGQVVDDDRASVLQERFIRKEAEELREPRALADLEREGRDAHEKWLFKFRGELFASKSFLPFIKAGLTSPEYGLLDIFKVAKGSSFSSSHMKYDVIEGPLIDNVLEVDVPVYFLMGRHDYVTPLALVEEYCEVLKAPHKQIIGFEKSAHFPFFEEPESFAFALKAIRNDRGL